MRERRLYRDPVKLILLVLVPLRQQIDDYMLVLLAVCAGEKHLYDPVIGADALAAVFEPRHVSGVPLTK
jgi:hypothetical protein